MGSDNILTDDYVAELLAQDAADRSAKYSTMGLEAYRSPKYVAETLRVDNGDGQSLTPLCR